jgi:hypothetical protein
MDFRVEGSGRYRKVVSGQCSGKVFRVSGVDTPSLAQLSFVGAKESVLWASLRVRHSECLLSSDRVTRSLAVGLSVHR